MGENRTHDLFLTKEEHFHYATTALEPAKRLELLMFVCFLTKEVLSPLNHAGLQSNRYVHCLMCFGAGCRNRTDGNSSLQMRRSCRCANPAIIIGGVAGNRTQVRDISVQAFSTSVFYCCLNCRTNRNPTTVEELSVRHLC